MKVLAPSIQGHFSKHLLKIDLIGSKVSPSGKPKLGIKGLGISVDILIIIKVMGSK